MKEEVVVVDDRVGMQVRPEVELRVDERRRSAWRIKLTQRFAGGNGGGVKSRVLAHDHRRLELSGNVERRRRRREEEEEEEDDGR